MFACPGILQNKTFFYKIWPSVKYVKLDWPQSIAHVAPSTLMAPGTIWIAFPDMLAFCPLVFTFPRIPKYARDHLEERAEGQTQSDNSGHVCVGAEPAWGPRVEEETLGRHLLYV